MIHPPTSAPHLPIFIGLSLADAERVLIEATLDYCDGDKGEAARMLGVSARTVHNKLKRYRCQARRMAA